VKKIYWKPRAISRRALALIAVLSLAGVAIVERFPIQTRQANYAEKLAAAELASNAFVAVKEARIAAGHPVDLSSDPLNSGLIGVPMSGVTTVIGHLRAKQVSVNPNFAAVLVDMLERAGVRRGDTVAIGVSGSFPAINCCVYAAAESLDLKPIIISSAASSQWGANFDNFLWLDMEAALVERRVFQHRSIAASVGGVEDRGLGMSEAQLALIRAGIARQGLEFIEADSFAAGIDKRMDIYEQQAAGRPIAAYINVGGGTISVGKRVGKRLFEPGLNLRPPHRLGGVDGVMVRFAKDDVPVIHFSQIVEIAERYALSTDATNVPLPGQGGVFEGEDYNRWLAGGVLLAILGCLYAFVHSDVGFRILNVTPKRASAGQPQQMV
jgi:poly-gamma-glutamate system protein